MSDAPDSEARSSEGLAGLESALALDLERLNYPPSNWVIAPANGDQCADQTYDVVVIGGGMCGLSASFAAMRLGISNLCVLDAADDGLEGPWLTYARMQTLRSPKHLTGPAQGIPNLTFRAWYEAQHGAPGWGSLGRIPRPMWMEYLSWFKRVLRIPARNRTRVERIEPLHPVLGEDYFAVHICGPGGRSRIAARRVVLATGREGLASARIPPAFIEEFGRPDPDRRCWHSSEMIDFSAMAGRRVAVVGFGASAFDNAACALEAGAESVYLVARSRAIPRINKAKGMVHAGYSLGFANLSDAEKFRFLSYVFECRVAPPRDSVLRVSKDPRFELIMGADIEQCRASERDENPVDLHIRGAEGSSRALAVEQVILGTGFQIDLERAELLASAAPVIRRWRDQCPMQIEPRLEEFLDFPYLGSGFEFLPCELSAATQSLPVETRNWADKLSSLYCFSFAAALSLGNISGDIPAVSEGAERLARAICRSFFTEASTEYWRALQDFDDPELLGDELVAEHWQPPVG